MDIGDVIPDIVVLSDENREVRLSDFKGKNIVLYFYPKDNTPGCTIESCGFGKQYQAFQALNTEIIGVSKDSVKSHQGFKKKFGLPFMLLADINATLCQAYGVLKEGAWLAKVLPGIERSTFLIDKNGVIRHIWKPVKVSGHVEEVLKKAAQL